MYPKISFIVPGEPKAQGRPRFSMHGGFPRAYDPKTSADFKSRVAFFARENCQAIIQDAVKITIDIFMKRPKSRCRIKDPQDKIPCVKRPDCDNFGKGICDALNGIAWRDDSQVQELLVRKWYHEIGGNPRTQINIEAFSEI